MRPATIFLARLIGLLLVMLALAMALHQQTYIAIAAAIVQYQPLLFIVGLILLTCGLAMVLAHNVWSGGVLPIIITLIGWITLIRGLIILLTPPDALAFLFQKMHLESIFPVVLAITAALGGYLTYAGFWPTRRGS